MAAKISENYPEIFAATFPSIYTPALKLDLNLCQERTQVSLVKTGGSSNG